MRARYNVKTVDSHSFTETSFSKLVGNFFALLSLLWVVGRVVDGLGVLYAFDISWTDDFPLSLRLETVTIFSCMFSLVLGFWVSSEATSLRLRGILFGLVGLVLSAVLFYRLGQGIPSYRPDQFDTNWVALSGLVTLFFALLVWRLFSGWLVFSTALVLSAFIIEDLLFGAGDVLDHSMVFWLIKSGAWNTFSSVIIMGSPFCLLAFRADQIALGYQVKRRSFVWLARTCSVPYSVFRFTNSDDLFWSKLSVVALPILIFPFMWRFEFGHFVLLCTLLFGVIIPLILGRFLGRFADSRYFKKRTTFFVVASLIVAVSYLFIAVANINVLICAVFAVALTSSSRRIASADAGRKTNGTIVRAISVLYGGMFLTLLAALTFGAASSVSLIWDYGNLTNLRYPWHIAVSVLVPIVVVSLVAKLRGNFSKVSKDAVMVGFTAFLYFAFVQGKSPGMSGTLSVLAMLGGTLFGVFAGATFEKRKGFLAGLSEATLELYRWAIGCVSVLVPVTVIAIVSAAVCSVIYYPIY
ncbi:hypothetical protein [Thalassospira lucentensis]|uniref:hypothetical protein n=1 Tax=Thalassospira lucentensis TaxID=168935 RepID=UPI0003B70907|nr:hypothetical protein [Thalassospira lucentensis]RCK23365.1 hypothetical protein TH1_15965 [Thalassospira lucentensis MCCC 1A00383 = DSM 14000]